LEMIRHFPDLNCINSNISDLCHYIRVVADIETFQN
jgi:hypothetical protein